MKTCFIMRGLPGSGKSTLARKLVEGGVIHSTDDLRMRDGKYCFHPEETATLHATNFRNFQASVDDGVTPVVVDNTNIRLWEFSTYIKYATTCGYTVVVVAVSASREECVSRNLHEVPVAIINRMMECWEPY